MCSSSALSLPVKFLFSVRMYYLKAELEPFLLAWCLAQNGRGKEGETPLECSVSDSCCTYFHVSWVCVCNARSLMPPNSSILLEEKLEPTSGEVACSFLLAKIA